MTFRLSLHCACMALMVLMFTAASASPMLSPISRGLLPPEPGDDPFYQPPSGFENKMPGTILRARSVTAALFSLIPDPVEVHQVLYRTTAVNGSAIAAVTTVFKPWFPKEDRFVSFQTAYDSSATQCDPSYTYRWGSPPDDLITSAEMLMLQVYLLLGYIVASPDYEGPEAAFSPGHLEGMAVLDNMRAVSNFRDSGLATNDPMIVGIGYSGGAIATGWAASLQPTYAPELNLKGWAQGGTPANLSGTLLELDDTIFSGFIFPAVAGLLKPSAYATELKPLMDTILTDRGRSMLDFADSHCSVSDLLEFPEKSILSTDIQTAGNDLLYEPTVSAILGENVLGVKQDETPTAPVFVYHAANDEVIPYSDASKMVDLWCSNGARVKFTTFGNGGHITTEIVALVDVVDFVEDAFAGNTWNGCARNTVLNNDLDPLALGLAIEPFLAALANTLARIGSQDQNIIKDLQILATGIKA